MQSKMESNANYSFFSNENLSVLSAFGSYGYPVSVPIVQGFEDFDENKVSCLFWLSVVGPFSPSQIATHLTRRDIERLAFSAGHFKRGEGCVRLVRDVLTSVEQDGVLFTAKCE